MTTSQDARDAAEMAGKTGWGAAQSRLVTWHDPMKTQATVASMSGLAYWRGVADGHFPPPPIAELVQMRLVDVERGHVAFSCTPDGSMYNPLGMVHGGLACTLLDTATGCALHTTLPEGVGYTSIEIKVNYLKAISAACAPLTAAGSVVKAWSRIGFAEASLTDASGALVATATSTLLAFGSSGSAKHSKTNGNSIG